jgi:cell division protein FtsW (lipid II flippase)
MAGIGPSPDDRPSALIYWRWRLSTLLVATTAIAANLAIARWSPPVAIIAAGAMAGISVIAITYRRYNIASQSRYGASQFHAAGAGLAATTVTVGLLTTASVGLWLLSPDAGNAMRTFPSLAFALVMAIVIGSIIGLAEGAVIAAGYLAISFLFLGQYYVKREKEN